MEREPRSGDLAERLMVAALIVVTIAGAAAAIIQVVRAL